MGFLGSLKFFVVSFTVPYGFLRFFRAPQGCLLSLGLKNPIGFFKVSKGSLVVNLGITWTHQLLTFLARLSP